ncbi:hypothetical protein GOB93_19835 [Acetobacter musti]|uniref:F5/8 type C domain-containing protein n=1 Tax=Acetobacter musti TaxID=864732 RepID=A0ABX0JVI0_9PROT|nr:discoidin domain-containing protein [Acetobacter musti]NHN86832.1 hypothetical protein [Acetobacter musti]
MLENKNILVAVRTHFWNEVSDCLSRKLYGQTPRCDFVILADETGRIIDTSPFEKISHTSDFSQQGLPHLPKDCNNLHFNGDYALYALRKSKPGYDLYCMVEADAILNIDVEALLNRCLEEKIDFVADISEINSPAHAEHHRNVKRWFKNTAKAFFPVIICSGTFIDKLYKKRISLISEKDIERDWPYCETFTASMALSDDKTTVLNLRDICDISLFNFMNHKYVYDPTLYKKGTLCHPVTGKDFVKKNLLVNDVETIFDRTSNLYTGISCMDGDSFVNDLEIKIKEKKNHNLLLKFWNFAFSEGWTRQLPAINIAFAKPATQSSTCEYSFNPDLNTDASCVVDGFLNSPSNHTDTETDPWWMVDLESNFSIRSVVIYVRPFLWNRFNNFTVMGSEDGNIWESLYQKDNDLPLDCKDHKPVKLTFGKGHICRYIKIVQRGSEPLHLSQVEVYCY